MSNEYLSVSEKVQDLHDDLLTVLDGHMDEIPMESVFYESIKFMTHALYECIGYPEDSQVILRLAMDEGIKQYMDRKEH